MKDLKIYEIQHDDEKTWVCDYTAIKALQKFLDEYSFDLTEIFDENIQDIVQMPSINWNQFTLRISEPGDEETESITFWEFMKHQKEPEVFCSTLN